VGDVSTETVVLMFRVSILKETEFNKNCVHIPSPYRAVNTPSRLFKPAS